MIKQNFMEKLLDGVNISWESLGEVADYEQPTKYLVKSKNYSDDFDTPVLTAGKTFILGYTDEINGIYKASKTPVIIFDDFTTANKWVDFDFKAKSSAMKMITSKNEKEVLIKYIYYWLNTLPNELIEGDHKRQWISNYSKKPIPIPPLKVQTEIVRILDTFTELTAELTARKKQYDYYRDKLFSFEDEEVEWKTLGEVGEVIRGNGMQKKDFIETGFPAVHYGQIYTKYGLYADETFTYVSDELAKKLKIAKKNDLLIATTSENDEDLLKPVAWLGEEAAISGDMMLFKHNENVKYIAYYFHTTDFQKQKTKYITGAKVRRISKDNLAKMMIPIPKDPNEQERIASILDKFEALTTSISEGLPREIELRQKQYEYYRNMLLSFSK